MLLDPDFEIPEIKNALALYSEAQAYRTDIHVYIPLERTHEELSSVIESFRYAEKDVVRHMKTSLEMIAQMEEIYQEATLRLKIKRTPSIEKRWKELDEMKPLWHQYVHSLPVRQNYYLDIGYELVATSERLSLPVKSLVVNQAHLDNIHRLVRENSQDALRLLEDDLTIAKVALEEIQRMQDFAKKKLESNNLLPYKTPSEDSLKILYDSILAFKYAEFSRIYSN